MLEKPDRKRKIIIMGVLFVFLMSVFAVVIPQPVAASNLEQNSCAVSHTVKAGETLSSIASLYDVTWQEIAEANNLQDPYTIFVGQVLCIPESSGTSTTEPDDNNSQTSGSSPSFEVEYIDELFIRLKVVNYPENQSHWIRAGVFTQRWIFTQFEVIDRFRTTDNGTADVYVRLPKEYRNQDLVICIKNAFTDVNQCEFFSPFDN